MQFIWKLLRANGIRPVAREASKEIQVTASELLSSVTKQPKSDDGFDVFV